MKTLQPAGLQMQGAEIKVGDRSIALGGAALTTCMCSTAKYTLGGVAFGAGVFALNLQTLLTLLAASAITIAIGMRSNAALMRALTGFLLLGGGYLLAPPATMSRSTIHTLPMLGGYLIILAGVALIVWALLLAYPTTNQKAAGTALGGLGAAAGCSCCMTTGAAVWLGSALGISVPAGIYADGIPFVLFMSVAITGLFLLGGRTVALIALAGAVVAFAGDEGLKQLPNAIERWPRLIATFIGMLIVIYAFGRALRAKAARKPRESSEELAPLAV